MLFQVVNSEILSFLYAETFEFFVKQTQWQKCRLIVEPKSVALKNNLVVLELEN